MKVALLSGLLEARQQKRPVVLVTDLDSGEQRLLGPGEGGTDKERAVVRSALDTDRCQREGDRFYQPHNPPLRLVVVGAVHVAQSLVPMAQLLGYDVLVVDPRPAFASPERFADVPLFTEWPDEALEHIVPDERTAIVTFTHDPKIDDPALVAALASPAFYIGALGSKKTHAKRLERLREAGVSDEALMRIHGPIGLPLGGRAPAEIALSTMAQITQVLREGHRPSPTSSRPHVVAVVLAAGQSRRMGERNKLLIEVDGVPMVARVVDSLLAARVHDVVVVTGHEHERVERALAGRKLTFVHNPDHATGMGSSVRRGVEEAQKRGADAVVIALGDMPWIRSEHVDALVEGYAVGGASICVPVFETKRGNPVLLGARWFDAMKRLNGDRGARRIIAQHPEDVRAIPMSDGAVLVDVDTPETLASLDRAD